MPCDSLLAGAGCAAVFALGLAYGVERMNARFALSIACTVLALGGLLAACASGEGTTQPGNEDGSVDSTTPEEAGGEGGAGGNEAAPGMDGARGDASGDADATVPEAGVGDAKPDTDGGDATVTDGGAADTGAEDATVDTGADAGAGDVEAGGNADAGA